MDLLKNLVVNLRATGPAAVVGIWSVCIAMLGVFGGEKSVIALSLLVSGGMPILYALLTRTAD
jgi:hypothetical protein